jgi:hypothetical protein
MLEFIIVMLLILVTGFILLMLTSIFLGYATQANYVDESYEGHEDD